MSMSGSGLKGEIESKLSGAVSPTDFGAGGSDGTIGAIAEAVVSHVTGNGKANVTCSSSGSCSNTLTTPGAYVGTGTASSAGNVSGLSGSTLQGLIKSNIAALLDEEWAAGNSDATSGAIATAIVDEVQNNGKITVTTTDSGFVPAGGGPVTGAGTGMGVIDSLDSSRLHSAFKSELAGAITGTNFTKGNADASLQALAEAIVEHVHANADVTVVTDLASGVTCPSTGGAGGGNAPEADGAIA